MSASPATSTLRTLFVVNPRSAGGKTAGIWGGLEAAARKQVPDSASKWTEGAGHATEIAREALKAGYQMVVSVGGDGTNNEVINGFFDASGKPIRNDAIFATVPRGTGCDFARGMGIPRDPAKAFARLAGTKTMPLDVGRIDLTGVDGKPVVRHFVNIAGFGANGDVVARVNKSGKKLGGFATFLGATVASLATFRNPKVKLSFDDGPEEQAVLNVVFVCNAQYCGGGMKAGPEARIDDGLFDVTVVGDMSKTEALLSGRLLYSGKIYTHPKVRHVRAKKVTARPVDSPVLVEADGEQPGILPATWQVLPAAFRLKV